MFPPGSGAYEDFAVFKQDFARSLVWLNVSGYCDVDISRLSVTCPHLNTLILNFSIIGDLYNYLIILSK